MKITKYVFGVPVIVFGFLFFGIPYLFSKLR